MLSAMRRCRFPVMIVPMLGCLFVATPGVFAAPGAGYSHQVQQQLDRVGRETSFAATPVTIIVEADPATPFVPLAASHGGKLRYRSGNLHEVTIPAGKLSSLIGGLPDGAWVRLPYPYQEASVTSQGAAITGALDMHALGQTGAGVTIGIIDLYFAYYTNAQASGELPPGLAFTDYTGSGAGTGTHGTSVAEIVHDMAPGASLRLARVNTEVQLGQAVNDMIAAGTDVIVHSVVWFGGGFYDGSGRFCAIADSAEQAGAQWVNAVGNHRNKHYLGMFTDSNGDLRHEFAPGQNFNTINLTAGVQASLVLNWDAYPNSKVDYDLYLYSGNPDSGGTLVAVSANKPGSGPNGGIEPIEVISYTPAATGTYYAVVRKANSSTANLRLTLFSNGPDLGVKTAASSLLQPSNCVNVIGVGAVSLTDSVDWNSSQGPTTDGRPKPEVTAPTGVVTSMTGNFSGTSAATPHVGGAVALLKAQNPGFSNTQIRWLLTTTAKDVYAAGYDDNTGHGRISLDADGDGYNHDLDNCPLVSNVGQLDTDADSLGNACDSDDDNDGLPDVLESLIGTNPLLADTDGDGLSDYTEIAYDGNSAAYLAGQDLNPLSGDTDGDGLMDAGDPIPLRYNYGDGDLAPAGAPDGVIDVADYLIIRRIVLGASAASMTDLAHGDLYPAGAPDGVIDMSDLVVFRNRWP